MQDKIMRGIVIAMVLTAIITAHMFAPTSVAAVMSVAGALITWVTRSPLSEEELRQLQSGQYQVQKLPEKKAGDEE